MFCLWSEKSISASSYAAVLLPFSLLLIPYIVTMNGNMFLVNSASKLRLKKLIVAVMSVFIVHNRCVRTLECLDNPTVSSPSSLRKKGDLFASVTASDCCGVQRDPAFCESALSLFTCALSCHTMTQDRRCIQIRQHF